MSKTIGNLGFKVEITIRGNKIIPITTGCDGAENKLTKNVPVSSAVNITVKFTDKFFAEIIK